jgi:hypothetical protein
MKLHVDLVQQCSSAAVQQCSSAAGLLSAGRERQGLLLLLLLPSCRHYIHYLKAV